MRVKYFIKTGEELSKEIAIKLNSPYVMEIKKTDIAEEAIILVKLEEREVLSLTIYDIDFIKHPILADLEEELDEIFANLNFYIGITDGEAFSKDPYELRTACEFALVVLLEEFNGLVIKKELVETLKLNYCFEEAKMFNHNKIPYYHYRNMKEY